LLLRGESDVEHHPTGLGKMIEAGGKGKPKAKAAGWEGEGGRSTRSGGVTQFLKFELPTYIDGPFALGATTKIPP
jgi:hypothetical protein